MVVDQLPRLGKRELICLLFFTCNYVVFVWRGFFFLWVLGMGYVILLWHSLSLPYNYFSEAKGKLRLTPFTSKLLFDGQIGDIYMENVAENHKILVKKAVTNQAKPNLSAASSRKPKAKSGKNKPKPQETPKKDFPFPSTRPPRRRPSSRGSSSRGRGAGPSRGGASTSRKH